MATVYLVNGVIEDGMQGIPFTLGIFTDLGMAHQSVVEFIDHLDYEVNGNCYSIPPFPVSTPFGPRTKGPYIVNIAPYQLNTIIKPKELQ